MTLTEKSIQAFRIALLDGRNLQSDVARTLLSCSILADAQSCRLSQMPVGSTWEHIARAALKASKGLHGNKIIRWTRLSAAQGSSELSSATSE